MQRLFDIVLSATGLIFSSLFFLVIAATIKLSSKGPVFFKQKRVGMNERIFNIVKFRTMHVNSDKLKLTIGSKDSRITWMGSLLRKFKLDELPQLFNVLVGEMSIVGPRPEVPEYVKYYSSQEKEVLKIRPGITDWASIKYINENDILAASDNPEKEYIEVIMREKLRINRDYLENYNLKNYFKIILSTLKSIF